ncbi:MAG TPA: hypothetical protein VN814_18070 [Caulobacteraceae bacterium]|nr:hypothetical protein [Caulobacteraceae bacterium]
MSVIWKTALVVLGCLVAADIAGAIAVTIFDILPLRFVSAGLAYAIWLVFGVFCGLFAYNIAGDWASPKAEAGAPDWSARPGARRIGTGIVITSLVVIAGLAALFYAIYWSQGVAGDDYVPDSEPHSIVFFVAVLGAMAAGRFALMPTPDTPPMITGP